MRDEEAFRAFVEANGATLLHAARLLTGDHHRGEDLVQTTLTKCTSSGDRIDAPLAYARKALVTGHIDSTRRQSWGERPTETLPETRRTPTTLASRDCATSCAACSATSTRASGP